MSCAVPDFHEEKSIRTLKCFKCIVTFENVLCDFILFSVFFHYDWLAVSPHAPLCLYRMAADRLGSSCAFAFRNWLLWTAEEGAQQTAAVIALSASIPARIMLNLKSQLGIPAHKGSARYGGCRRVDG